MRSVAVILICASWACAGEGIVVDDFEAKTLSEKWTSVEADIARDAEAKEGSGALRCDAAGEGAWFGVSGVPADWNSVGAVEFWARTDKDSAIDIEVRERASSARFRRRVDLVAGDWQRVEVPLWQFRSEGTPAWSSVSLLGFDVRGGAGTVWIDDLQLASYAGQISPFLEPRESIAARAFGGAEREARAARGFGGVEVEAREDRSFRIFADAGAHPKLDEVGTRLGEFLGLFQKTMGMPNEDLPYPATLVICKTREAYVDFVVRTAKEVYNAAVDPKGITSDGFTFEQYSCTYFDPKQGAARPVFYHEACHQLVVRCLGLRGPRGATWAEEGVCYLMQNEYLPQANLADEVKTLLANAKRPPLDSLDDTTKTTGAVNLTGMLVMGFVAKGTHREELGEFIAALRHGASLKRGVEDGLGMKLADFETEWLAWCRETYP